MQNNLIDLNNHLFAQLERLDDEDITEEQLNMELRRSEGMTKIAEQIIHNGELAYKTMVHLDEYGYDENRPAPEMLDIKPRRAALGNGEQK